VKILLSVPSLVIYRLYLIAKLFISLNSVLGIIYYLSS